MKRGGTPRVQYRCSFRGKSQEKVHRLIAGPGGVYICNECIDLCREIIEEEQASLARPLPGADQDGQLVWRSSAQRGAGEPAASQPTEDRDTSGGMGTPDTSGGMGTPDTSTSHTSTSQRQLVNDALRAQLAPLAAELEETRLARTVGARERRVA